MKPSDYEYRVIWKRNGWTSPVRRVYASKEAALRQIERVETAMTWQPGSVEADPVTEDGAFEGPWPAKPLLYIHFDRRPVGAWEPEYYDEAHRGQGDR